MSEHAEHSEHSEHGTSHYVKIWAILTVLLMMSVAGPMAGIEWVTLITAFGIAVVKAYLVAKNFMHINIEKRFITYIVMTCLVFMLLFFAGVSPDVMKPEGSGWQKPSWIAADAAYARGDHAGAEHLGHPAEGHH